VLTNKRKDAIMNTSNEREVIKMEEEKIFYTIKELYDWAIKNGYENYNVLISDEGCACNIYLCEISVDDKKKRIIL
jgi:hypothetical protein